MFVMRNTPEVKRKGEKIIEIDFSVFLAGPSINLRGEIEQSVYKRCRCRWREKERKDHRQERDKYQE